MKVSYKGDYALKAMLQLALKYGSSLVSSHELARQIDAPMKFLEQVLMELRRGGFVESKRGSSGGYMLSRDPDLISVGDIIRHIEGPIEPISCVDKSYTECSDIQVCVFRDIWTRVYKATTDIVDNITLKELVDKLEKGKRCLSYVI